MHYNLWRVFSGKPAASRLSHHWGLDRGKVREKTISLFALLLPLSASNSSGLVALFPNSFCLYQLQFFEGKGSLLLPAWISGTLGHRQNLLIYGTKHLCHNHSSHSWLSPASDPNPLYLLEIFLLRETLTNFLQVAEVLSFTHN